MKITEFVEKYNKAKKNKTKMEELTDYLDEEKELLTSINKSKEIANKNLENQDIQKVYYAIKTIEFGIRKAGEIYNTFAQMKEMVKQLNESIEKKKEN